MEVCNRLSRIAVLILGQTLWCGPLATCAFAAPPNVVFILADDLGARDLGCYGADLHETPNLDRLARQGLKLDQAYAMSVCSPTRASILTGKHAARLHITVWREQAVNLQKQVGAPNQKLIPPAPTTDLPRAERTLAELFRDHGYATLHVGKWHLGDAAESPEVHGFDVNIGGTHWGAPATYFHPFRGLQRNGEYRYVPGLGVGKKGDELTDRLTDEALALLDQVRDRPFFLNLWYHTPHTPIEAKPELTARFRAKLRPELKHQNPAYAAMVASLDANVGRVLDYLEAHDLARNTLVVFTSDNGGYVGTFDHLPVTSNAPLRSGKGSLYEGGIRVPTLVRWPGVIPAGTQSREPLTCTDFWPTFHSLLGDPISPSDGLNLLPLWKDPSVRLAREALFFHYPHYYDTTTPASAVRAGNAKLIHYFEDDRVELYDLAGDPGETTNRAPNDPATAARLRSLLDAWRREVGAQMPKINASYRPPGTARP